MWKIWINFQYFIYFYWNWFVLIFKQVFLTQGWTDIRAVSIILEAILLDGYFCTITMFAGDTFFCGQLNTIPWGQLINVIHENPGGEIRNSGSNSWLNYGISNQFRNYLCFVTSLKTAALLKRGDSFFAITE